MASWWQFGCKNRTNLGAVNTKDKFLSVLTKKNPLECHSQNLKLTM